MIIDALTALPSTPTTGDELPIERGTKVYKIDYDALATAILDKLGAGSDDVVDIAHGGTGATTAAAALAALGGQPLIKVAESEDVSFANKAAGAYGYVTFTLNASLSGKTILGLRFSTSNITNSKGLQLSITGATNSATVNVNYYCPAAITATCNVKLYVYYC